MSDQNNASGGVRVVPGRPSPAPEYRYQSYDGRSGSASSNHKKVPERQFAELQSLNLGV
ncbi:hypothetical protein [Sphingobium subterraneum]|uniref:Uncharacterized protein n=1 Tax=Sphingobium subterraneum TaxID=627688 RepID=A0A841J7A0_9SPHN|nr:hypothetical protein [Sphingobium subterraneum]MBB6124061.1 hypothetical protein [Sphingobium subterraneum]